MAEEADVTWITVNGAHIPIKAGEDKDEAIDNFFVDRLKKREDAKATKGKKTQMPRKEVAYSAGLEAGKSSAKKGGGKWSSDDYNAAVRERNRIMGDEK